MICDYRTGSYKAPHLPRTFRSVSSSQVSCLDCLLVPVNGGEPEQITSDLTHKPQPARPPLGDRIAFTICGYRTHFWRIHAFSFGH